MSVENNEINVEITAVDSATETTEKNITIPEARLVAARTVARTQDNKSIDYNLDNFDLETGSSATFGTAWPSKPARGDLFLKVDTLPNKLYKWTGRKWIEIDRSIVDNTLAFNTEYIDWQIGQIHKGHANYQSLGINEQEQIKSRIASSEQ